MSVYLQEDEAELRECANCGATEGLLRCSRCRSVLFCSLKCQKAYWPFHKPECKRNEFADAIQEKEPKFAAWMRKHGKQAVLKDDEVDRLERAGKACTGFTREDVMDSMYGRLVPSPKGPSYTAEEVKRMREQEESDKLQARLSDRDRSWEAISIDSLLGVDCGDYKWQQNQSYVEIFCLLPENVTLKQVEVSLQPAELRVVVSMRPVLCGRLHARIKQEESTWFIEGRVLYITLLKLNRRGNYENGSTNADTFWRSVLQRASAADSLQVTHPPPLYYSSFWEAPESSTARKALKSSRRPRIQESQ